jgi:hypothetical protein
MLETRPPCNAMSVGTQTLATPALANRDYLDVSIYAQSRIYERVIDVF